MCHLMKQSMARRLEVLEALACLAPAAALVAVVLPRIEIFACLVGCEE